ncbi:yemanuclein isoform X2 [Cylas formicarius]|nr:yemanuclein isoform X2 [Cylas formicarius]
MEAKYGSGLNPGTKKRRKGRKDDYADIGAGYDESDSFIDNTDGYDEIIPPNVTTARGGFYINSGALEFKTDDEATSEGSSSGDDEEAGGSGNEEGEASRVKKKRALDTTDDEEADSDASVGSQTNKKDNLEKPKISMQQAIKKKMFSPQKIQVKKRRLLDSQKRTVKDLLREKRTDLDMTIPEEFKDTDVPMRDGTKENKKPMKLSSVSDAIESVISRLDGDGVVPLENNINANITKGELSTKPIAIPLPLPEMENHHKVNKFEFVKLPENLPSDIIDILEGIKRAARDYKAGGKLKFFSGEVNVMLLQLERKCKCLGRSSRVKVYEHLSHFVQCRKETLVKRAKNLVLADEQKKMNVAIIKLKTEIDQKMPSLISNHEKECQKVLQQKFSHEATTNDELKALKAPRRRFTFSEDMKRLVRDILGHKKRCLLLEGRQKDSIECLLLEYLKNNILVLWPDGWMSMVVLKKFCSVAMIKTPDPKLLKAPNASKGQKLPISSAAPLKLAQTSANLTITPVNLNDKLAEVVSNQKLHETTIKPINKDGREKQKLPKDNGVIVMNSKEETVIATNHCQIIDLTEIHTKSPREEEVSLLHTHKIHKEDTIKLHTEGELRGVNLVTSVKDDYSKSKYLNKEEPVNFAKSQKDDDLRIPKFTKFHKEAEAHHMISSRTRKEDIMTLPFAKEKEHLVSHPLQFKNEQNEIDLKKLQDITVTPTMQNDRDDVQKVMESLKALQKLSSPAKTEVSSSPVSVIAFNKSYSNSSHGVNSGGVGRTDFVGFQDEFQKQFISSLSTSKSNSVATKSYNRSCS